MQEAVHGFSSEVCGRLDCGRAGVRRAAPQHAAERSAEGRRAPERRALRRSPPDRTQTAERSRVFHKRRAGVPHACGGRPHAVLPVRNGRVRRHARQPIHLASAHASTAAGVAVVHDAAGRQGEGQGSKHGWIPCVEVFERVHHTAKRNTAGTGTSIGACRSLRPITTVQALGEVLHAMIALPPIFVDGCVRIDGHWATAARRAWQRRPRCPACRIAGHGEPRAARCQQKARCASARHCASCHGRARRLLAAASLR